MWEAIIRKARKSGRMDHQLLVRLVAAEMGRMQKERNWSAIEILANALQQHLTMYGLVGTEEPEVLQPCKWKARDWARVFPVTVLEEDLAAEDVLAHALRRQHCAASITLGKEINVSAPGYKTVVLHDRIKHIDVWKKQPAPVTFLFEEF